MRHHYINIGYSTCPNDTFIFRQLAECPDIRTHLHDVETLNLQAFKEQLEVTKLSFHTWLLLRARYRLLNCGAALGRGCGPLVIVKQGHELSERSVIAVPGAYTTAHLLLRLWNPKLKNRIFMRFNRIMKTVESGAADAGIIIHEGRLVWRQQGFQCRQDLGAWWEQFSGQLLPLGCIAAHKRIGREKIDEIERRLKKSIQAAFDDPGSAMKYVKKHAQELDEKVISAHINTYVNRYTLDLGDEGRSAIAKLQEHAEAAGIVP